MSRHPAYSAKPFFLPVAFPVFLSQHDLQQFSHGIHIAFLPGYLPLSELFRRTVGIIACSRPFFFSVPQASQIQDPHSAVDTDPDIFRLQIPVEKWMLPLMKRLSAFRDLIREPRCRPGILRYCLSHDRLGKSCLLPPVRDCDIHARPISSPFLFHLYRFFALFPFAPYSFSLYRQNPYCSHMSSAPLLCLPTQLCQPSLCPLRSVRQ